MNHSVIGVLLENLDALHEAKGAGLTERRIFFRVTSKTQDSSLSTIVEAPSESRALVNATLVWGTTMANAAPAAIHNINDAKVEQVSAFTPNKIPFFAIEDNDPAMSDWIFKAVKKEQTKTARRFNKYPYVLPMIPVAHPDAKSPGFKMIPAYEVPDYVAKGFKVVGRANTQRRLGSSTETHKG